jgi:drug/metabolite transporter (DMT)-like permease
VSRRDTAATSLFWTGTTGLVAILPVGAFYWQPMSWADTGWMLALSVLGVLANWLLIRAYGLTTAGTLQPFAYLQLVFASAIGISVFGETLRINVATGGAIVVCAGLFTLLHSRRA